MALQTKTVSTAADGYVLSLTLTERDMDRKANTTSVSYKLTISNSGAALRAAGYSWSISIAGQTIPIVDYTFALSKSDPKRNIATGRITVQHDPDGTLTMPYGVSIPDLGQDNGPGAMEIVGEWELTPVPRIPTVYCPGGYIGEAVTIRVDALDENLTYSLGYRFGDLQGSIAEKMQAAEISWIVPEEFYAQIPKAREGTCYLSCVAYSGDVEIGAGECRFAVKVDAGSNAPSVYGVIEDCDPLTLELTGDASVLVRYCSDARVSVHCEAKNSAYVEAYSVTYGGATYYKSTVDIGNVETGEFRFTVTDSRGITATETMEQELIPYIKLTCNLADNKPDGDGDMTVKVTGNYFNGSFGLQSNSLQVEYRYKVVGGAYGAWISMDADIAARSYTAQAKLSGLDNQTAYVFQARATDRLWIADSAEYTVKATPVFDWDENDFNVNGTFKINQEAVADFVISRGKNEIWTWEKWNSGIAKCWGTTGEKTFTFTDSGPIYHSETAYDYNYPLALTEVASVNANILSEGYVVPVVLSASEKLRVSAVRLYGGNASVKGKYAFQVLGRWK